MATIVPSVAVCTEFAGKYKILFLQITTTSAADSFSLVPSAYGFVSIVGLISATIAFAITSASGDVVPTISGTTVTVSAYNAAGSAATAFGLTNITYLVQTD